MLLRQPLGRGRLYDLLHRGVVSACIFVTVVSTAAAVFVYYGPRAPALPDSTSEGGNLLEVANTMTSNQLKNP